MAMCYIQVYYDWLEAMEALSDGERGRLIVAALKYARGEVLPELSGGERYVWPMVRAQIDRDREAYSRKAETQRANGLKGGRPKTQRNPVKANESQNNPRVFPETQKTQEEEEEKEKDEEEHIPPSTPRRGEARSRAGVSDERFAAFWAAYPRKVGKAAARKVWDRIRPNAGLHARMLAAVEAQKQSAQWRRDGGQYIPHPSTWLGQGRWDDVVSTYATGATEAHGPKQVIEQQYSQRTYDPEEYDGISQYQLDAARRLAEEEAKCEIKAISGGNA